MYNEMYAKTDFQAESFVFHYIRIYAQKLYSTEIFYPTTGPF